MEQFNEELNSLASVELFQRLKMSKQDLKDPMKFGKFQDLVSFFDGKNDPGFWISKVTQGKNVDSLDQMWEYSKLYTRRNETKAEMEGIGEQLEELEMKEFLSLDDTELKLNLLDKSQSLENGMIYLNEEIGFYEN